MLETTYSFTSLQDQDSILLIHLLPGEPSADFECELVDTRLRNNPDYRAISYVWGSKIPGSTIRCPEDHIVIIPNCDNVLRRIRDRYQPVTLGHDAFCINQRDLLERSQQVGVMVLIYRQASSVLICLGPAIHESDSAGVKRDVLMLGDFIKQPLSRGLTLRAACGVPLQSDVEEQLVARDWNAWNRFWKLPY